MIDRSTCSRHLCRRWIGVVGVCFVALAPLAYGQGEKVGEIEEIRRDRTPVATSPDVLLTASPAYTRKAAKQSDTLHVRELVELLGPYYVRARLCYGRTNTRLYAGSSGANIGQLQLLRQGAYEILPNRVDPLSGLELRIRHGVLVVEHVAGRLDTKVRKTLTTFFGTTALFAVDSTRADAFLFLREGHIAFPDHGIVARSEDTMWWLRDGFAPERISLTAEQTRQLRSEVEFLSSEVWRGPRPFYGKPGFYVPVGAAVLGVGILLIATGGDDEGERDPVSGTAIIRIPH